MTACVGTRVALLAVISSILYKCRDSQCCIAKLPYVTVPVVVIALDPFTVIRQPLVMEPLFNAPTVVTTDIKADSKYVFHHLLH